MIQDWTEFVIGIIMIISPWIFGFSDISVAKWCNILLGLALVLVNAWTIFPEPARATTIAEETQNVKRKTKHAVD